MGELSATILASGQAAAEGGGGQNFLIPNATFFVVLIIFLIVLGVIGLRSEGISFSHLRSGAVRAPAETAE